MTPVTADQLTVALRNQSQVMAVMATWPERTLSSTVFFVHPGGTSRKKSGADIATRETGKNEREREREIPWLRKQRERERERWREKDGETASEREREREREPEMICRVAISTMAVVIESPARE